MDWRTWRVCIAPGDAVVAREGRRILVAGPSTPAQEGFLDELLALCTDAHSSDESDDALRRAVGLMVVRASVDEVPSFGLLTPTRDGLAALLVGDTELVLTNSDGTTEELHGRSAALFADRLIPADVSSVFITLARESAPDLRSNLSEGVVRGSGVLLAPGHHAGQVTEPHVMASASATPADREAAAEPDPTPAAEPDPTPEVSLPTFISISLTEPEGDAQPPDAEAVDDVAAVGEEAEATQVGTQVQGIVCSRGHFNDPTSRFCALCGISMVQQTHHLVTGLRPPLGVVVLDDGAVYALTKDYVVGRDPEQDPAILSGRAVPLILDDPDLAMSRVHARILLDGWEVRVEDAHSANGTFVARTPDAAWTRLEPGLPTTIAPGTRLTMGGRTLVFESHQNS